MKRLRLHILKICIIALVCSGLIMSFAKPANAGQSNKAFANWLQSLTKKTQPPELEQELSSLEHSGGSLNQLIEKASKIVSENNDDFNLPESTASQNIQQLLLVEWNQYQSGNAMTAVASVERAKQVTGPQHQKTMTDDMPSSTVSGMNISIQFDTQSVDLPCTCKPHLIAPLVSGIAIGAP